MKTPLSVGLTDGSEVRVSSFIEAIDRNQATLFPALHGRRCGTAEGLYCRPSLEVAMPVANGPDLPFTNGTNAVLQLSRCGHSCTAQHFQRMNDDSAGQTGHFHPLPILLFWQPSLTQTFLENFPIDGVS